MSSCDKFKPTIIVTPYKQGCGKVFLTGPEVLKCLTSKKENIFANS